MKHPVYQGRRLSSLTLGLLVIGCVGAVVAMPTYLRDVVSGIVHPLLYLQRSCTNSVHSLLARRATVRELELGIHELREENRALMAQVIELEGVAHYAHGVEELVAFKRRYELHRAHCVQILSKTFSDQAHFFLVDAGSLQGIQLDMIALYNNVLLGRVVEVYPNYSKIILTSDRGCKVAAYCARTGASGIHEGCNSLTSSLLSRVSHLETIQEQDIVISSGEGLVFPQGFALGNVAKIERNELFYIINITPLIDVKCLSYCMLISKDMIAT